MFRTYIAFSIILLMGNFISISFNIQKSPNYDGFLRFYIGNRQSNPVFDIPELNTLISIKDNEEFNIEKYNPKYYPLAISDSFIFYRTENIQLIIEPIYGEAISVNLNKKISNISFNSEFREVYISLSDNSIYCFSLKDRILSKMPIYGSVILSEKEKLFYLGNKEKYKLDILRDLMMYSITQEKTDILVEAVSETIEVLFSKDLNWVYLQKQVASEKLQEGIFNIRDHEFHQVGEACKGDPFLTYYSIPDSTFVRYNSKNKLSCKLFLIPSKN